MTGAERAAWEATRNQPAWQYVRAAANAVEVYTCDRVAARLLTEGVPSYIVAMVRSMCAGSTPPVVTGDHLRTARKSAKLSQAWLAAKLGIGAQFVSQWELGRRPIPAKHIDRLTEILGPFGSTP